MVTRNDFYKFRMLIQEFEQKTAQYKLLEDRLKAPSASVITAAPKNQTPVNRLEYLLSRRVDLSDSIRQLKLLITKERKELDAALQMLNICERTVLESRYYLLYSWEEIASIIFEAYPDFKSKKDDYIQKVRRLQSIAFKKIESNQKTI